MPGVRLVTNDPELRGRLYLVEHPYRKYIVPKMCPRCNVIHVKKTYHLQLDGEGAVIVSVEMFERLREAGLPRLQAENEVLHPPHQRIGLDAPVYMTPPTEVEKIRGGRARAALNKLIIPRSPKEVRKYSG